MTGPSRPNPALQHSEVPVRGILLDFYGTVVHEDDVIIAQITNEIAAASRSAGRDAVGRLWWRIFSEGCVESHGDRFRSQRDVERASLAAVCEQLGAAVDIAEISERLFDFWQHPPVFPDAPDFLAVATVPVIVASNIDRIDIEAAIEHHGLVFEEVITSEDVRSYKPRPELFEAGLAALDMAPSEVLHVGDSLSSDIAGASALGIRSAWINRKGKPRGNHGPTHEATSLTEFLRFLP